MIVSDLKARSGCEGLAIYLSWLLPAGATTVRVYRRPNDWGYYLDDPADLIYDGAAVSSLNDVPSAPWVGLAADTFYYYTVVCTDVGSPTDDDFEVDSQSRTFALSIPVLDGKDWIWDKVPSDMVRRDAVSKDLGGGGGDLERWVALMGCMLNLQRGRFRSMQVNNDYSKSPYPVALEQSAFWGMEPDGQAYDFTVLRKFNEKASHLYTIKGTCPSLVEVMKIYTGWDSECIDLASTVQTPCAGPLGLTTYDGHGTVVVTEGDNILRRLRLMGYEIHSRYGYATVDTVVTNKFLPATAVSGEGSVPGPPALSLTYMQQNLPAVALAGAGSVAVSGLSAAVDPTVPILLYRRSLSDYQDVARTTPAGVGASVRSATDIAYSPHHFTRSTGVVPTARSGGGLVFLGGSGNRAWLKSTLTVSPPFVVLVRCTAPASQDAYLLCDSTVPDNARLRLNASYLDVVTSTGSTFVPIWAYDTTPRVLGLYVNGASSKAYVNGTKTAYTAPTGVGYSNGIRVGSYVDDAAYGNVQSEVTDIGIWSGTFTDADLDAFAALLNSAPLHTHTGETKMADKPTTGGNETLSSNLASATIHLLVSGVEVGGGVGYSSQSFGAAAPSGGSTSNSADINFGTSTSSWGTIDAIQIKKSGIIMYQKSITPTAVAAGYAVKFLAGAVTVTETLGGYPRQTGIRAQPQLDVRGQSVRRPSVAVRLPRGVHRFV